MLGNELSKPNLYLIQNKMYLQYIEIKQMVARKTVKTSKYTEIN